MVAQTVKNLPAMWETCVWSLGREDLLEKGMATHSSIFASKIPWTEEPGGLQYMGSRRVRHDWATNTSNKKTRGQVNMGRQSEYLFKEDIQIANKKHEKILFILRNQLNADQNHNKLPLHTH